MDLKNHSPQILEMAQKAQELMKRQEHALDEALSAFEAQVVEDELQAYSFCQEQLREIEAQERLDQTQRQTTQALQAFVAAPATGALATIRTKQGFPIGSYINAAMGLGAAVVGLTKTNNRALRVVADVGKVMLHSQISMSTRDMIED